MVVANGNRARPDIQLTRVTLEKQKNIKKGNKINVRKESYG